MLCTKRCPDDDTYSMQTLSLLNADAKQAAHVHLDHKLASPSHACIGQDGQLHLVEASRSLLTAGDSGPPPLTWYTIDPASGRTVSSLVKHRSCGLHHIVSIDHAQFHRLLCMVDPLTMAVMDAETVQEISRFVLPSHLQASSLNSLFPAAPWSADGSMLAMLFSDKPESHSDFDNPAVSDELLIVDCLSGQCLQTFELGRAQSRDFEGPHIEWSCTNLLVVSYDLQGRSDVINDAQIMNFEDPSPSAVSVRVLDPAHQKVSCPPGVPSEDPANVWDNYDFTCEWTPCGNFLQLSSWSEEDGHVQLLVDSKTMDAICTFPQQSQLSWGVQCPMLTKETVALVYDMSCNRVVRFSGCMGRWQMQELKFAEPVDSCQSGGFSPDGSAFVGVFGESDPHIWHLELPPNTASQPSMQDSMHPEQPQIRHSIVRTCPVECNPNSPIFGPHSFKWIPVPKGWPPMYACMPQKGNEPSKAKPFPGVFAVVDLGANRICCKLVAADCGMYAGGQSLPHPHHISCNDMGAQQEALGIL